MALSKNKARRGEMPEAIKFYFSITSSADTVVYKCFKCNRTPKQRLNTGYTNLYRHLDACQGKDFREKCTAALKNQNNNLGFETIEFVSERDLVVFKWLKWVIMRDMPFAEVDNELTRELAGLKSSKHISSKSVRTNIGEIVPLVENLIATEIPECFAIMFDGWQLKTTHYVAVFAVYMKDDKCMEVLLGFSPPLDEKSYTAQSHRDLLEFVLEVYNRSLTNISVLIGDNCATNKATADLVGVPLLGCAAHKFNLAVKRYVKARPNVSRVIEQISTMCTQATNLKAAAALRELTDLTTIRNNDTRWSSTFQMIDRFFKIEHELRGVHEVELPRHADLQVLRDIFPTLKKFNAVMVGLQGKDVTVASARGTFDALLEDYPEMSYHLAQDASIVHEPIFEAAVVKVINRTLGDLSTREKDSIKQFEITSPPLTRRIVHGETIDYYNELQERKRRKMIQTTTYEDLSFMKGTSAAVERLFSAAKYVMTDRRSRLTPVMFEAIMFLKVNRDFWDSRLVAKAIRKTHADDKE